MPKEDKQEVLPVPADLFRQPISMHKNAMGQANRINAQAGRERDEWASHWSDDNQRSWAQRFFSFYRQAIFSRTVQYFVEQYFPRRGTLLEAGSGTSETSIRINKHGGARKLVAMDIVLPVLAKCQPVMDARLGGDLFRLPLATDSLDGLWNVGVMEHFADWQIDEILKEFHRVVKPGCCIILLWPGADSIPQRMLRVVEWLINLLKPGSDFRFHPAEISQLQSKRQALRFLSRNGFHPLEVEFGFRSLFAFKTVVGKK